MNQREQKAQHSILGLDASTRSDLWQRVGEAVENYGDAIAHLPVAPKLDVAAVRGWVESFDFAQPQAPMALLEALVPQWTQQHVHTTHPGYFGLFNPAPSRMSIVADTLVGSSLVEILNQLADVVLLCFVIRNAARIAGLLASLFLAFSLTA